jgi:hypothetical protein
MIGQRKITFKFNISNIPTILSRHRFLTLKGASTPLPFLRLFSPQRN